MWFALPLACVVSFSFLLLPPFLLDRYVLSHYMSSNISGPISCFIWFLIFMAGVGYTMDKNRD